jgi:hypothetical protein
MLRGAALRHKQQFILQLTQAGDPDIVVRQPAVVTSAANPTEKVLGRRTDVTPGQGYGDEQTILAIRSDASLTTADQYSGLPARIAAIGRSEAIDILLRCLLEDVLLDPNEPYGRTIFDSAKDVLIGNAVFLVRGTDRTGLPPEGPYILWVALKRAGE